MVRRITFLGAALLLLAGPALPASAQVAVFPTLDPSRWVRVEAGHADMSDVERGPSALSSAWFLTFTTPVPGDVVVVMEFPMAYMQTDTESNFALGNPYVGARMQFYYTLLSEFEIGLRLPLAPRTNEAMNYGLWADLADRAEAFMFRSLVLNLRGVRTFDLGWELGWRHDLHLDLAAGSIWWLMEGEEHTEQNAFLTYSGQLRTRIRSLHLATGASGRYSVLGRSTEQLADATHQWTTSADLDLWGIRPGAFLLVPMTQPAIDRMGVTAGIRLLVPLGGRRLVR